MNRLWCCVFGHKWRRWGGDWTYKPSPYLWRRTLHAECQRCGRLIAEDRRASFIQSGALCYIKGGYVGQDD